MSDDTGLGALLQSAGETMNGGAVPDPRAVRRRARRRRRTRGAASLSALLLLVGAATWVAVVDDSTEERTEVVASAGEVGPPTFAPGWERLPDAPLSGRISPVAAWTGEEVLVIGGSQFACPPNARCDAGASEPPLRDGAAFDPGSRTWRPIAEAPVGVAPTEPAVVGGQVFLLAGCHEEGCELERRLLEYRPDDDRWLTWDAPPVDGGYGLGVVGGSLVAFTVSDEQGERPTWVWDAGSSAWVELPDDPLPPAYDRHVVDVGGRLTVFAKAIPGPSQELSPVIGAVLDLATGTWEELPTSPASGFQAWPVDGRVVVNPHFGRSAGGGIYDPADRTWQPLPEGPDDETWRGDMAGVLGRSTASFEYEQGWVLDLPTGSWVEVEPLAGRDGSEAGLTAVGRSLFTVGGVRWSGGTGELLQDAWVWTPPAAGGPSGELGDLTVRLELARPEERLGAAIGGELVVENTTDGSIPDPGCVLHSYRFGLVPEEAPGAPLDAMVVSGAVETQCQGSGTIPRGFSERQPLDRLVRDAMTDGLEPGVHLFVVDFADPAVPDPDPAPIRLVERAG